MVSFRALATRARRYTAGVNRLLLLLALLLLSPSIAQAEKKVTYDLVTFTPPAPYKKTAWVKDIKKQKNSTSYTMTDKAAGTYCQIFILRSRASKGDLTADFEAEWKDIVVASYGVKDPPQMTDAAEQDGWTVKAGVATFAFANGTSIAMLTTLSGYDRAVSIVAVTSGQEYAGAIQDLLGSVEMKKPAVAAKSTAKTPAKGTAKGTAKPQALQGYMDYNPITKSWTWKVRYPPQ